MRFYIWLAKYLHNVFTFLLESLLRLVMNAIYKMDEPFAAPRVGTFKKYWA